MISKFKVPAERLEPLTQQNIEQSKLVLNAALSRVMKAREPKEFRRTRKVIFSLLDSRHPSLQAIKYILIEGRFLDAADALMLTADRALELRGDYLLKAALIYLPFTPQKAVRAFDKAVIANADLSPYYRELAELHRLVGDRRKASHYADLYAAAE